MKDGCGKPAQVELDVSLSCLNVFLVADIHRLSPISRQRDANQTCRCEQQFSTLRQTTVKRQNEVNMLLSRVYLFVLPSIVYHKCAKP